MSKPAPFCVFSADMLQSKYRVWERANGSCCSCDVQRSVPHTYTRHVPRNSGGCTYIHRVTIKYVQLKVTHSLRRSTDPLTPPPQKKGRGSRQPAVLAIVRPRPGRGRCLISQAWPVMCHPLDQCLREKQWRCRESVQISFLWLHYLA